VPVAIDLNLSPEAVGRELEPQQIVEPPWVGMIKKPSHCELVAELRKREGPDTAMVILANRPDVGDLGGTFLGERFDVMEFDIALIVNRVVFDEAVKHPAAPLLCENLLLLRISKLPIEGRHL
jgi:hypothetical protein